MQRYVIETDGKYILSKTNSISSESEIAAVNNDRSTFVTIYDPDKLTFPAQKLLGNPRQFDTVYSHTYMGNMVKIAKDKAQKNKTIPKTYLTDEQDSDNTSWETMKTYYDILKRFLESVQKQEVEKNEILEKNHNLIEAYRDPQSLFYTYGFRDAVGAAIMILQGKTVETLEIEKTLAIIEQDIQFIKENSTQDQVLPGYFNGYDCEAFAKAGHKFFDLEFSYYKGASTIPEYGKTENINPKADQSTTGYSFHCWNTLTQPIIGGGELTAETCAGQGGPFTVVFCIRPIGCTENITTNEDIRTLNEAGRKSIEYQQVLA